MPLKSKEKFKYFPYPIGKRLKTPDPSYLQKEIG